MNVQKLKQFDPLTNEEYNKYWPIIQRVVSKFVNKKTTSHIKIFSTKEDLENELYPALLEAIRLFDPEHPRKLKIETWIATRCHQRMLDFIRSKSWISHMAYAKLVKEERAVNYIVADSYMIDVLSNYIPQFSKEDYNESLLIKESFDLIFTKLSIKKDTYDILYDFYVNRKSLKEVCNLYSITKKDFDLKIKEIKKKLRAELRKNEFFFDIA